MQKYKTVPVFKFFCFEKYAYTLKVLYLCYYVNDYYYIFILNELITLNFFLPLVFNIINIDKCKHSSLDSYLIFRNVKEAWDQRVWWSKVHPN